nr:hypothetical protein StreXyl84_30490 [Streptomyces sp. Xyl84]
MRDGRPVPLSPRERDGPPYPQASPRRAAARPAPARPPSPSRRSGPRAAVAARTYGHPRGGRIPRRVDPSVNLCGTHPPVYDFRGTAQG